jgi:L-ascorbate metabolism protein UlaG (beta-lactamase superfamily)
MDIQFYGANCFSVTYKGTRVVIDDNLADLGGKSVLRADDVALYTAYEHAKPTVDVKLVTDRPGEYEVGDVSIHGVGVRAHMDEDGKRATMYKITAGDVQVLFVGHVHPDIKDAQLEAVNQVDVMIVPVGGMGYTLDAIGALKLIKEFEPKLVIPSHYAMKGINYPVPQADLDIALKELAMEPKERVAKLKLKPSDFGEGTQLIILEKS